MRVRSTSPLVFGVGGTVVTVLFLLVASACTAPGDAADLQEADLQEIQEVGEADHFVPATAQNLSWGWFPIGKEPVLTVQSGETVRINTITHVGATQNQEPVEYLTGLGIPREEILQDVIDFWASRDGREREGRSGHTITGPIYVDGAEPGDMLEVQILDIETRVPWGANNTSARGGVFSTSYPGYQEGDLALDMEPMRHVIRTGTAGDREVAFVSEDIQVPLAPFMGIMAVAPDPQVGQPSVTVEGVQGSRAPGAFGGNMDVKDLTAGATLYLPVFHSGARFYVGDPHGAQGDGEGERDGHRTVAHRHVSLRAPQERTHLDASGRERYALHDHGDRSRSGQSGPERHVGGRAVPSGGKGALGRGGALAREHRRRLPRQ